MSPTPAPPTCHRGAQTRPTTLAVLGALAALAGGAHGQQTEDVRLVLRDGAPGDGFGWAVDVGWFHGIVGAPQHDDAGADSGTAFVYDLFDGDGCLELLPDDGVAGDRFGASVAASPDVNLALVGAQCDDLGTDSGAVYVFNSFAGTQLHKLTASDGAAWQYFGGSVSVSGAIAVIGARGDTANGVASGAAYVFDVLTGQELHKLLATDGAANDSFGWAVAIHGDRAVVSAWEDDDNGNGSGSAYLFDVPTGQQLFKLLPLDGAPGDNFGASVAIGPDHAVVCAPGHDANGSQSGAAYVFDIGTGQQVHKLLASDGALGDFFGISADIDGDRAVIGAYRDDDAGTDSGATYVFELATGLQVDKLVPANGAANDYSGFGVAIGGGRIWVGSRGDDPNGLDSGAAHAFDAVTGAELFELQPLRGGLNDLLGVTVAIEGTRAVLGAPNGPAPNPTGAAYVLHAASGQTLVDLTASDGAPGDWFGGDVGIHGDRVIVGAEHDDDNGSTSGSAYVFDVTGQQLFKLLPLDGAPGDEFGTSVAIGANHAVVGAPGDDDNGESSGAAYVFDLFSTAQVYKLLPAGGAAGQEFGSCVAIDAGRVLVGSKHNGPNGPDSGAAHVFDLATGLELGQLVHTGGSAEDGFGAELDLHGDLAIVGAAAWGSATQIGAAYVFDVTSGQQLHVLQPADGAPQDAFGTGVALDGFRAVVGAARHRFPGPAPSGAAYLFDVNSGLQVEKLVPSDPAPNDEFGWSVAVSDVRAVVGAYGADPSGSSSGAAYAYPIPQDPWHAFCPGDGSGTACPCANLGGPGEGCANSTGQGGLLAASGSTSVAADDLALAASQLIANQPALLFAGQGAVAGGAGIPFGDGLRCAGMNVVRLGVRVPDANGDAIWGPGLASTAGWNPGDTRYLQGWYRDPTGTPCGSGFNLTHGLALTVVP